MSEDKQEWSDCPDCGTEMFPADDFDCEQVSWVCPQCAPDFVLALSTTHSDLKPEEYGVPAE